MAITESYLVDRRCRLTIASPVPGAKDFKTYETVNIIEIDGGVADNRKKWGMRVSFKIEKSRKKEPNNSEIVVTNLAPGTRADLQKRGTRLLLEAGYRDGVDRYFSGDVRTVDHIRADASWDTKIALGDGERAWNYARINESFAPGTRSADVLRRLAEAMGLDLGNLDDQLSTVNGKLDQGFAASGSASRALDQFITSIGKEWSVQDGQLQILDPYAHLPESGTILEVTPDSGLIGSPEMGSPPQKGKPALIKFKFLLRPTKPGARIRLKSRRYDGYVTVHAASFTGDTHGGDWYTEVSGVISK